MSKKVIALIVAGSLLVAGLLIGGAGILMGGMRSVYITSNGIEAVNDRESEPMNMELTSFTSMDISVLSSKISLIKSDRNEIEYDLSNSEKLVACEVINDVLVFKTDPHITLSMFSFDFKSSYVNIYYKDGSVFENVSLKSASGIVEVDELNATGNVTLSSMSGSVRANGVTAKSFTAKSTSGARELINIKAESVDVDGMSGSATLDTIEGQIVNIKNVSGRITAENISCTELSSKNTSGSTTFKNLTSDKTSAKGASGSISIQGSLSGKTTVSNVSGSVKLYTSLPKNDYGYSLSSTSGSTKVNDETFKGSTGNGKENFIDAKTTSGSVKVYFDSNGN